jgi:hypothetical protein
MTLKQIHQLITTAQDSCAVHVTTLLHENKMDDQWFHINCQRVNERSHMELSDTVIRWRCIICNKPNYMTICYIT